MKELSDLVVNSQKGDREAFGELVERFQDMAVAYAYSMLNDFHLAEDAAQDAFVKCYSKLPQLKSVCAFSSWFRRILSTECQRIQRVSPAQPATDGIVEVEADMKKSDPAELYNKKEIKDKVLESLEILTQKEKTVTALFYINGYSMNEVGEFLEIPAKTVKSRLFSARKKLEEKLMSNIETSFKSHAPKADLKEKILHKMEPKGIWGHWETEGDERVAIFHGGPSTTLVSPESWAGDALVVEFDTLPEKESQWGLHVQCALNPYPSAEEQIDAKAVEPRWRLSCGRREKAVWAGIRFDSLHTHLWSRDVDIILPFGDFNGSAGKWYHVKVERIKHMLRLWIDGVVVSEYEDKRPLPKELFVWLQSVCCNVRFRNVEVYRPDDAYIKVHEKPVPMFAPINERDKILASFDGKTVQEASIILGENNESDGLVEVQKDDKKVSQYGLVDNKTYRSSNLEKDNWGVFLKLNNPEEWNFTNQTTVEFEHYDAPVGDMAVFYRTWHYHGSPTPDFHQSGQNKWTTSQYMLRDAAFAAPQTKDNSYHIWFHIVRSEKQDFKLHRAKLTETAFPDEAYLAVVDHYGERISHYMDSDTTWPAGHYLFHKALVYIQNLGRIDDGVECLKKMATEFPDCECIDIYQKMRVVLTDLPEVDLPE